jgi:predicted small secreted protein
MRRLLIILSTVAAAGLTAGCNMLIGGPSSGDIEATARAQMVATAPNPQAATAAHDAEITPRGICNHQGDVYACIVDVKVGATQQQFVVEMKKNADGNWVSAN